MAKAKKPKAKQPSASIGQKMILVDNDEVRFEFEVLTLEEAAAFLRVTPEALKADAMARRIPALFVGGEWRFAKHTLKTGLEVVRVLKSQLGPPAGPKPTKVPTVNSRPFFTDADLREPELPKRIFKSMTAQHAAQLQVPEETPEEFEAFLEILRVQRDEADLATKSGRYAEE